jgi:hypothetical protein
MARKGWGQLSDAYKRRLERGGITRSKYERGESLQRARGHTKEDEGLRRLEEHWMKINGGWTDQGRRGFAQVRKELGTRLVYQGMRYQRMMQDAYEEGDEARARELYNSMPAEFDLLPDWMRWYHGMFST